MASIRTYALQYARRFLPAVLAVSGSSQAPPAPAAALADIPALMEYYHVPGVSIAIVKDSKIGPFTGLRSQQSEMARSR